MTSWTGARATTCSAAKPATTVCTSRASASDQVQGGAGADTPASSIMAIPSSTITMTVPVARSERRPFGLDRRRLDPDGQLQRHREFQHHDRLGQRRRSGARVGDNVRNYLSLGAGDDRYIFARSFHSVDGGAGIDGFTADYSASERSTDHLEPVSERRSAGTRQLTSTSNISTLLATGSGQHSSIVTANLNRNDFVLLGGGNDTVALWNGHDTVNGGVAGTGRPGQRVRHPGPELRPATNGVHNVGTLGEQRSRPFGRVRRRFHPSCDIPGDRPLPDRDRLGCRQHHDRRRR